MDAPNIPAFMDLLADAVQNLNAATVSDEPHAPERVAGALSYLTGIAAAGRALYSSEWAIVRTWQSGPVYARPVSEPETAPEPGEGPEPPEESLTEMVERTPASTWHTDDEGRDTRVGPPDGSFQGYSFAEWRAVAKERGVPGPDVLDHPENYEGECYCQTCLSYAAEDGP